MLAADGKQIVGHNIFCVLCHALPVMMQYGFIYEDCGMAI